jgi:DNA-directed RNA polymerase subunit RPC12/RpoP
MALQEPTSMEQCSYFTRRNIGDGEVMVWVSKNKCDKCNEGIMEKPKEKGKTKIRAKEYVCTSCGNIVEKAENEEKLFASIKYTCPKCRNQGELQVPFIRKKIQGAETLRFQCQKCNENIDVTKKMKKKKGE